MCKMDISVSLHPDVIWGLTVDFLAIILEVSLYYEIFSDEWKAQLREYHGVIWHKMVLRPISYVKSFETSRGICRNATKFVPDFHHVQCRYLPPHAPNSLQKERKINISERSDELLAQGIRSLVLALLGAVGDQLYRPFRLVEICPVYGVYVRCDLMSITTYYFSWGYRHRNPDKVGVNCRREEKHHGLLLSTQYPDGINLISPRNPMINDHLQADWNSGLAFNLVRI